MHAPLAALVFDTYFRAGEKVEANRPVLSLLSPNNIKVLFYITETQLSRIKIGQKIYFTCDGCADKNRGLNYLHFTRSKYTPPVIYSKDTRYKLVY